MPYVTAVCTDQVDNYGNPFKIRGCFEVLREKYYSGIFPNLESLFGCFHEFHRSRCSYRSFFKSLKHLKNHFQNYLKAFQNSFYNEQMKFKVCF